MARRAPRPQTASADLDARKATILDAVVVEHIDTAQPVGSSSVAASADLASRRRRCAPRWWPSSARATSPSPTPRPAGCRPTRATATSWTTSRPAPWARPSRSRSATSSPTSAARSRTSSSAPRRCSASSPATPRSWWARATRHATVLSVQLVNLDARHHLLVTVFSDGVGRQAQRLHRTSTRARGDVAEAVAPAARAAAGHDARRAGPGARRASDHVATLVREAVSRAARRARPRRGRAGLHRRVVQGRRGLRRRRDGAPGPRDPRAGAPRRDAWSRTCSTAGSRSPSAPSTATSRSARCAVIVAPVTDRGRARRRRRPARADAHEVPRGDGRGARGLPAPARAHFARRGRPWLTPTSTRCSSVATTRAPTS